MTRCKSASRSECAVTFTYLSLTKCKVEFYFSDSNLPSDKFLFSLVGGHENKAVPIQTIHNFKRMRHFQPFSAVVDALRESSTLNVVEVEKQETKEEATDKKDQDDTDSSTKQLCVQRKHPLPEGKSASSQSEVAKVFETAAMARSIYAKGFGVEQPTTQFDLEAFFSTYGPTNAVRLRRAGDKTFKGSVFVEFADEETARTFLEAEPKPTYHGRNLVLKSKKQYCDEKVDEINRGQIRGQSPKASSKEKERDWRERREEDRKKGFPPVNGKDHSGKKSHEKEEGISRKRGHKDLEGGDEENGAVKKVDTEGHASADKDDENIADAPAEVPKTEEEGVSRKRSNEDMDAGDEGERAAKKVDSKEVVSAVEAGTNAVDENPEAEATS